MFRLHHPEASRQASSMWCWWTRLSTGKQPYCICLSHATLAPPGELAACQPSTGEYFQYFGCSVFWMSKLLLPYAHPLSTSSFLSLLLLGSPSFSLCCPVSMSGEPGGANATAMSELRTVIYSSCVSLFAAFFY